MTTDLDPDEDTLTPTASRGGPSRPGQAPGVAEVPLSGGLVALVDDTDLPLVADETWRIRKDGNVLYVVAGRNNAHMHRLILGAPPELHVDHVNGDGLDNRRANLRFANDGQNSANARSRGGTSIYKGVHRTSRGRWRASIKVNYQGISLGFYADEADAARAYDAAAREHFGEFAALNFPGPGESSALRRPGLARPIAPGESDAPLLPMVGPRCIGGGRGRNEPYHASDEPPRHLT